MSQSTQAIDQKILTIMGAIGAIAKTGRNEQGRYNFVQEAELTRVLNPLFIEHKVRFQIDIDEIQKDGPITTVKATAIYKDIDSGQFITHKVIGQGFDTSDKGVYKAITGAKKYSWMTTFCIATGDDPENDQKPTGKEVSGVVNNDPKVQSQMAGSGKPFPPLSEEEILKREQLREKEAMQKLNPPTKEVVSQAKPEPKKEEKPSNVVEMPKQEGKVKGSLKKQEEDNLDMSHPDSWKGVEVIIGINKGKKLGDLPKEAVAAIFKRWKPSTPEEQEFRKHVESAAKFHQVLEQEDPEILKEHNALAVKLKAAKISIDEFMALIADPAFDIDTKDKAFPELDLKKVITMSANFDAIIFAQKLKEKNVTVSDWMTLATDPGNDWSDGSKIYLGIKPDRFKAMLKTFDSFMKDYLEGAAK